MAKNKKLIVGNWKMNPKSLEKAKEIFSKIDGKIKKVGPRVQVVMCPPAVYLSKLSPKKAYLGAQDVFYETEGAYTGEISPAMLSDLDVKFVIVGHSECRARGETDEIVTKKIKAALAYGITPIICVGETIRDPEGNYHRIFQEQIRASLALVSKASLSKIVIAYEPTWAIGVNAPRAATAEECQEMIIFIKKTLADKYGSFPKDLRIIYGASASPENAEGFLTIGGADGLLPGRDSLNPEKFLEIISIANKI